jgi:hypothetical protein
MRISEGSFCLGLLLSHGFKHGVSGPWLSHVHTDHPNFLVLLSFNIGLSDNLSTQFEQHLQRNRA